MANITGTDGKDTLTGTTGDDIIQGLAGDDRIIASTSTRFDTIDGGAGNDTVDLQSVDRGVSLVLSAGNGILTTGRPGGNPDEIIVFSILDQIENIVGNSKYANFIDPGRYEGGQMDIDLSINQVKYTPFKGITSIFTVKNFDNINGANGGNRLAGNERDNQIFGGLGNDVIIGSRGNDTLNGVRGYDILDYSNLGRAVTILPRGKIEKSGFGTDTVNNFSKIIGATNRKNTIDASIGADGASLNVNLANNSLGINIPGFDSQQFEVINFVNVIGSANADTIVGANKNAKLTGGGGSDTITGGSKNDRITGTDSTARGVGELDILTGGGGRNKFVLGDENDAYYVGNGNNDYATITDFNLFKDSINIGSLKNYSFALEGGNTLNLFSGEDINTRDLIAKIQIAGGISSVSSDTRSVMGSSPDLNSIIAGVDIISGAES